jgi:hypothetical protein
MLIGGDVHDIECDPFWRQMFIETAKRVQPEKIVFNGDLFDLPEFSKYTVDPRGWDVVGRIRWVHNFLKDLREVSPTAEITLIEGNHELRILRNLSEATPAMKAVLADLHGFTVSKLLGLDEFKVNYVARADLSFFNKGDEKKELSKNYKIFYDFFIVHHYPEGAKLGLPGINGHHHSHDVQTLYSAALNTSYEWHQIGCGHKRSAEYCDGEKWSLGFAVVHVDTLCKRAQIEYIDCTNDHCVIGGKWYQKHL